MKFFRFMVVLSFMTLLSFTLSLAAEPRTRGVQITARPGLTADKLYGQSHAVIIGIDAYTKYPAVGYAVKDARAMEQRLLSMGFQTNTLLDQQATKENILKILRDELPQKARHRDRVVVFFAGNTLTEMSADTAQMGYLVPVDADPASAFATSISMDQLREISARIPANHVLFLIDSCLGGLDLAAWETISAGDKNYLHKISARKAHQVLAAGGKGETANTKEGGLGSFVAYVLEGLNGSAERDGKGFVTTSDLAAYVKAKISRSTGNKQTPQYGNIAGKGEIIFTFAAKTSPVQAASSSEEAGTATFLPPPQETIAAVPEREAPTSVQPGSEKAAAIPYAGKDTAEPVEGDKFQEVDGRSLAEKQAQMEELKRQDEKRKKVEVAPLQRIEVMSKPASLGKTHEATRGGRFVAYDNGTVLDTLTNLMWAAKDNGVSVNWQEAKRYCENYRGGGYKDWRMPTQKELAELYDEALTNINPPTLGCSGSYRLTNLIHLTCCCPWASETRGSLAAYFGFNSGLRDWLDQLYAGGIRALPVRSNSR